MFEVVDEEQRLPVAEVSGLADTHHTSYSHDNWAR